MSSTLIIALVLFELLAFGACSNKVPDTRFYQLAPPEASKRGGDLVLVIDDLTTDAAYDDERIVYRTNPYRFDYYHYHRWSASPGTLVGNYLERAFENSGRFRAVVREVTPDAPVILGGRVVAIEEISSDEATWRGRIVLELTLTDARSGKVIWTEQYEETEQLASQSPEGLARALSKAMARIAAQATPKIAELAARTAAAHAEAPRVGRLPN
jgi:ABC-type uncharacterized transport system auxiliary subunit